LCSFCHCLSDLILMPYPEGAPMTPFDKCCKISEVSKLRICTSICTCNPTLKHFCPYHKCLSLPSHQKEQKCLRSTSYLQFSWLVSQRDVFEVKKLENRKLLGLCTVTQEGGDRSEPRTQDMSASVSVKDHRGPFAKWTLIIEHVSS